MVHNKKIALITGVTGQDGAYIANFLIRKKIDVETKIIKNCDHHIPIEASSIALNYIKKNLSI